MKQEQANRLILIFLLKKKLALLEADEKATAFEGSDPGDKKNGKAGQYRIGTVSISDPEPAWRVSDSRQFGEWVAKNYPDEILSVTSVRAGFEKAILAAGGMLDETSGELVEPPGIKLVQGPSVVTVRPAPDAEQNVAAHLHEEGLTYGAALDSIARKAISA